jgi:hypothetical protein
MLNRFVLAIARISLRIVVGTGQVRCGLEDDVLKENPNASVRHGLVYRDDVRSVYRDFL